MESQLSLSVELTKIIPPVSLLRLASEGSLRVVRAFRRSGSDFVTEHDLAAVFGRLRLDDQFERNFKNTIKASKIQQIANALEVVLEVGAGLTVQHAITRQPFFCMVAQLSALLWSHQARPLARCLVKILSNLKPDQPEDVPEENDVLGTLRSVQQQTCGYLWGLEYQAVETILEAEVGLNKFILRNRSIDSLVFATLMEMLPKMQHFPEEHHLIINTGRGIVATVIWAHKVLGFNVEVSQFLAAGWNEPETYKAYRFGSGEPCISIKVDNNRPESSIVVLNQTRDIVFESSPRVSGEMTLWPTSRHPILGYGEAYWRFHSPVAQLSTPELPDFALMVCKQALQMANVTNVAQGESFVANGAYVPWMTKIISVCQCLFPKSIDTKSLWDFVSASEISTPSLLSGPAWRLRLAHRVLSLAYLTNIEECSDASLSIDDGDGPYEAGQSNLAFMNIARALIYPDTLSQEVLNSAAAVSAWGWTLVLHSVTTQDLSILQPGFALRQGVPARSGVRKAFILDSDYGLAGKDAVCSNYDFDFNYSQTLSTTECLPYQMTGSAGETVQLTTAPRYIPEIKYYVGTSDHSFIVRKKTRWSTSIPGDLSLSVSAGFRHMQEAFWESHRLESCDCSGSQLRPEIELPDRTWAFTGILSKTLRATDFGTHDPWAELLDTGTKNRLGTVDANNENTPHPDHASEVAHENEASVAEIAQPSSELEILSSSLARATLSQGKGLSDYNSDRECRVHVSQTLNDNEMRWLLLIDGKLGYTVKNKRRVHMRALRPRDTCSSCAIKQIKKHVTGDGVNGPPHVCLIT